MMAVLMRNAKANPYWNVPPELVKSLTAKRVQEQGLSYLRDFHYEVLSDWGANAQEDRSQDGQLEGDRLGQEAPTIRVRQQPGPWNSMGEMKFEMPNDYGIYLHDTPLKELFAGDRWLSNGCVRLEDYRRFAAWVFGRDAAVEASQPRAVHPAAAAGADLHDLSDGRAEPQRRHLPSRPLWLRRAGDAADVRVGCQDCFAARDRGDGGYRRPVKIAARKVSAPRL